MTSEIVANELRGSYDLQRSLTSDFYISSISNIAIYYITKYSLQR